jgi:hypothetical protein
MAKRGGLAIGLGINVDDDVDVDFVVVVVFVVVAGWLAPKPFGAGGQADGCSGVCRYKSVELGQ